ncbi:alpha/beta fold hydrolase [Umezawaea tangerina]|uniref:Pimeloyl-ACP methyl ester carboxylesterase n=1 Tax=Umezawaea tangerina TaxID=84725 RepID=A0A2T0SGB5_9PSEU|nr:alpha/beta hydrolase [Umezawaea tangerina]PRY32445.1 pimeloyl-ACP methyl ester carboxylesterase [Umezawaea tangerina]
MPQHDRTRVLVHGVPETSAIWTPLVGELRRLGHHDVVRLSPPAFGAPVPDGFGATADEYRDWLIGELSAFDGPVDLVGHDFGGGHVMGAVWTRPDLVRSWVSDVNGALEPDYTWHALARTWQTPGDGEASVADLFGGTAADRAARMREWGILPPAADEVAAAQGPEMAAAVLALYRSAAQPALADRGRRLPEAARRPGLAVIATADGDVGSAEQHRRAASRADAETHVLEGLGHWWMLQDPARGARMLADFWDRV